MLPPILRTFFAKRKPVTRCTPDNLNAAGLSYDCIAQSIPRDTPETVDKTRIRDMMPNQIARNGQGENQ